MSHQIFKKTILRHVKNKLNIFHLKKFFFRIYILVHQLFAVDPSFLALSLSFVTSLFTYSISSSLEVIISYSILRFSKNKRGKVATIVPKVTGVSIGQREMLSKLDCMKEKQTLNVVFAIEKHPNFAFLCRRQLFRHLRQLNPT